MPCGSSNPVLTIILVLLVFSSAWKQVNDILVRERPIIRTYFKNPNNVQVWVGGLRQVACSDFWVQINTYTLKILVFTIWTKNLIMEIFQLIIMWYKNKAFTVVKILSRASEVGSPINPPWAPGSNKTRGQGSFGPSTGGPHLIRSFY